MKRCFLRSCLALAAFSFVFFSSQENFAGDRKIEVLCSIFPIYQIARNVTVGVENVELKLMLPAQLGCPHDYALSPQDMQKLAKSKVLVINGLGMEEFLGAPMEKANPGIMVIDSSAGIKDTLKYVDTDFHGHETEDAHEEEGHAHGGDNPHLFASPRMVALIAMNIAKGLAKSDPSGAEIYI